MSAESDRHGEQLTPFQRLASDFRDRLLAVRTWVADHEPQISAVMGSIAAFALIQPQLERLRERFEGTEWEYLLDRVDFATGIGLLAVLDREGTDGVERVLEAALGRPEALPEMLDALRALEMPPAHRRQLGEGLRHVSRRDYDLAVPLLMIPFEGLVSLHAKQIGLIEPHKGKKHRFTAEAGPKGSVGGIEDLLRIEDSASMELSQTSCGYTSTAGKATRTVMASPPRVFAIARSWSQSRSLGG